jgi:molybdenum cofactor cytidylyltransferase
MGQRSEGGRVAAIVLAAGGSARMGQPKQLLHIGDRPMVRHVTETVMAVGLAQVVVVTGADAEAVSAALADLPVDIVLNESWAEGMSGSIRAGLGALRSEIQAAMLVLGDQPALTPEALEMLVARYRATRAHIIAPFYQGRRGNPVLFDRVMFSELLAVQGDRGGRLLVERHRDEVERVDLQDPAVIMDIDSPQDYEGILGAAG